MSRPASPSARRTLSRRLPLGLSPATIRNAMADLEDAGLLYAPHTSAGRLPTKRGCGCSWTIRPSQNADEKDGQDHQQRETHEFPPT